MLNFLIFLKNSSKQSVLKDFTSTKITSTLNKIVFLVLFLTNKKIQKANFSIKANLKKKNQKKQIRMRFNFSVYEGFPVACRNQNRIHSHLNDCFSYAFNTFQWSPIYIKNVTSPAAPKNKEIKKTVKKCTGPHSLYFFSLKRNFLFFFEIWNTFSLGSWKSVTPVSFIHQTLLTVIYRRFGIVI